MMKFVHLKQLFVDELLSSFLILSKECLLFHKTAIYKVNPHAKPYQKLLKYRANLNISRWATIKTLVNFIGN